MLPFPKKDVESVGASRPARKLQILVADDHPANRILLAQQLNYLRHSCAEAEDGAIALEMWRNQYFDMIITDCSMPVMDGYDLARAIRTEEKDSYGAPVPIVGFTANSQTGEFERCLAAGMNDCMFKPISLESLEIRLSFDDLGRISKVGNSDYLFSEKLIDLTSLEQLTDGDEFKLARLIDTLVASIEDDKSSLAKVFTTADLTGVGALGHKVKSVARIIKASHLIMCCEHVEAACRENNADVLAELIDRLHMAISQVLLSIATYRR
ncbi:Hybrid sensory histidine kinase EvgS [Pseudomonas synxantha]|uniref:Hybrid sensory histidine kinase EvgS n=1 Tax=Pseudomonas synxantha TaxID=47883 RepID=A0A3G7UBW7_9PSED|nr:response regulator [Pseudomonas synxantha]AZE56840.1 Hybrid sensory histidine kinase EvgS [Pseudomonas synxantha]